MAFWRFFKVLLAAIIIFVVVNFFLTNSTVESQSLATTINFKFNMPPLLYLQSMDFSVGYLLIIAFVLGMIFAAIIGAINAFSRSREIKIKNKTIRELEKEIDDLRENLIRERNLTTMSASDLSHGRSSQLPENPEIQ
jgi:ribosomal protein L29